MKKNIKTKSFQKHKTNKDTYNRIASIYNDKHGDYSNLLGILQEFIKGIPQGGSILDLGSGPGQFSKYFMEKGFKTLGIDFSQKMIDIAKEKVPEGKFIKRDILKYKFENKKYDGVWASAVLLHFNTNEVKSIIKKISKSLNKNGKFYVSFIEGKRMRKFERVDKTVSDIRYFFDRTQEEVEEMLKKNGFRIDRFLRSPIPNTITFLGFITTKK